MAAVLAACSCCRRAFGDPPVGMCATCGDGYLCPSCFSVHELGLVAGHVASHIAADADARAAALAEFGADAAPAVCSVHGKAVELWCVQCNGVMPMCTGCVPQHMQHVYCDTAGVAGHARRHLETLCSSTSLWAPVLPALDLVACIMGEAPEAPYYGSAHFAIAGGSGAASPAAAVPPLKLGSSGSSSESLAERELRELAAAIREAATGVRSSAGAARLQAPPAPSLLSLASPSARSAGTARTAATASVPASTVRATAQAEAARRSLLAAVSAAEAAKLAALGVELAAVEAALGAVTAETARLRAALASLESADLAALHPILGGRLVALFAHLRAVLPRGGSVVTDGTLEVASAAAATASAAASLAGTPRSRRHSTTATHAQSRRGSTESRATPGAASPRWLDGAASPRPETPTGSRLVPPSLSGSSSALTASLRLSLSPRPGSASAAAASFVDSPRGGARGPLVVRSSSVEARDLVLVARPADGVPLRPGATLTLRLRVAPAVAARLGSCAAGAGPLSRLAAAIEAAATLDEPPRRSAPSAPLPAPVPVQVAPEGDFVAVASAETESAYVRLSVTVPPSASHGARLRIGPVSLSGVAVAGFPLACTVTHGLRAPLQLACSPGDAVCITGVGSLLVVRGGALLRFDSDGTPLLPGIPSDALGLSGSTGGACAYDDDTGTLLLVDASTTRGAVVAVNVRRRGVAWTTPVGVCGGIALLPALRLAVVSSGRDGALHVLSLDGGAKLASVTLPRPGPVAADPSASTVYASSIDSAGRGVVLAWRWDAERGVLEARGAVSAAGTALGDRPLVVLPPAPGKRTPHLVVGERDGSGLSVLALPGRVRVPLPGGGGAGSGLLPSGLRVRALAADPSGTALLAVDALMRVVVALPWPLPGMPPAE